MFDILLTSLLHTDTVRTSIQRVDQKTFEEFFLSSRRDAPPNNGVEELRADEMEDRAFPPMVFDDQYDDEYMRDYEMEPDEDHRVCLRSEFFISVEQGSFRQSQSISNVNHHESTSYIKSLPLYIKFPSILNLSQPILSGIGYFSPPRISKSPKSSRQATISSPLTGRTGRFDSSGAEHSIPLASPAKASRSHSLTIAGLMGESSSLPTDFHHLHVLIYTQSFDFHRVISTMNIVESLIDLLPFQLVHRLFMTTNIRSSLPMSELYSRHQRAIRGDDFQTTSGQFSYLFVLIDLLLIYIRSYSSKSGEIPENREIHLRSYRLLSRLCHDLSSLCIDRVLTSVDVNQLLRRVAFQKIILHLFRRTIPLGIMNEDTLSFSSDSLSHELIHLLEEMIFLEHLITTTDGNLFDQSLVNQSLFLSIIVQYLKNLHWIEKHRSIIDFIVRILPYCGSALKTIGLRLIEQICRNLCLIVHHDPQGKMKLRFK